MNIVMQLCGLTRPNTKVHRRFDWFSRPAIHDQRLCDVRELALDSMPKDLSRVSRTLRARMR